MARPVIDLTGERFGTLDVAERYGYDNQGRVTWLCQCDCGAETVVSGNNLRSGNTTRCGHGCPLR
jgi:hypothetical protein